jgi:hypothetical protein
MRLAHAGFPNEESSRRRGKVQPLALEQLEWRLTRPCDLMPGRRANRLSQPFLQVLRQPIQDPQSGIGHIVID